MACEYKNTKAWKDLVDKVGLGQAYEVMAAMGGDITNWGDFLKNSFYTYPKHWNSIQREIANKFFRKKMTRSRIDITDRDYEILKEIIARYRDQFSFYVFGSRVTGKARKYSDIDLAYKKCGNTSIIKLKNELDESNITITVDLVDLEEIASDFAKLIQSEMIPL